MVNFRPILYITGVFLSIIAALMVLPALADLYYDNNDWKAFLASAFFTLVVGFTLILTNSGKIEHFTIKQTFVLTTFSWVLLCFFAALPLRLAELEMDFTDAMFEAMSGLTTTGASVMSGLDNTPPGILLWRALLNWIGGIGIIVFAMAVLPMLKIGGMQLFRTESSDKSEKILPRATQISSMIGGIYLLLSVICGLIYWFLGMSGFDAICHAMATIATGGFSTHDASFGFFNSQAIELACIIFMILGALPFVLYIQFLHGRYTTLFTDKQVQLYMVVIVLGIAILTAYRVDTADIELQQALREVSFSFISVITTTGFATTDYGQWGSFAVTFFFLFMVMGGCTGSTTGGIKVFRYQVLYATAKSQITRLIQPHGIFPPRMHGKIISDEVTSSVLSFFILFAISFTVIALGLSYTGLDYLSSMSAAAQALANVGPGLGDIVGPVGNYSSLTDPAKWLITIGMLVGRLEIFTVLVLFSPYFWRD